MWFTTRQTKELIEAAERALTSDPLSHPLRNAIVKLRDSLDRQQKKDLRRSAQHLRKESQHVQDR